MKKFFIPVILLLLVGLVSCNNAEKQQQALNDKNMVLVDSLIRAVCIGDLKTADSLLAADFKDYGPATKDSATKEQFMQNWKKSWDEYYATMKYNRWVVLAENVKKPDIGNWVLEWGDMSITYKNGTLPVNFYVHQTFKLVDGKINIHYAFFDMGDIMTQWGVKFVWPGEEKQKPEKKHKK